MPMTKLLRLSFLALATGVALAAAGCGSSSSRHPDPPAGLHVSGSRIVAGSGRPIVLHGVNRSGTEYSCIHNVGIFDGPSNNASVAAIAAWHVNIVRVPLNEDCWLGVNVAGINRAYLGRNYIRAIVNYVNRLHAHGIYAEVSLIWGAPGTARAGYQPNAPDEDHSPAMWAGMAEAFKNDHNVILAPWGETTVGWSCFLHGCANGAGFGTDQDGLGSCGYKGCYFYRSAGMQQAVDVMRAHGYRGPIAIPCIAFANACGTLPDGSKYDASTWLRSRPHDPDHQLIAEAHVYGKNLCDTDACFNSSMKPILKAGFPLIWGETGETYDATDCGSSYISRFMNWADAHGVDYEAWTWDTWGNCSALIDSYAGAPHAGYGAWVKAHYASHPAPKLRGGA